MEPELGGRERVGWIMGLGTVEDAGAEVAARGEMGVKGEA